MTEGSLFSLPPLPTQHQRLCHFCQRGESLPISHAETQRDSVARYGIFSTSNWDIPVYWD